MTNDELIGGVLALLWFLKPSGARASTSTSTKAAETKQTAADDGQKLVARATQAPAQPWATLFKAQDVPADLADALSRWVGIESSGNATNTSPLGERGPMQIGKKMFQDLKHDGVYSDADWDKLISPSTSLEEQARLAYKFVTWLWPRAKRYVKNPPDDYISAAWYSKLYHQRPVDVRDGGMHGPAALMSLELADRWKSDAKKMHRLRAANVVAWGTPDPPVPAMAVKP